MPSNTKNVLNQVLASFNIELGHIKKTTHLRSVNFLYTLNKMVVLVAALLSNFITNTLPLPVYAEQWLAWHGMTWESMKKKITVRPPLI